jgi:hypothetical protein
MTDPNDPDTANPRPGCEPEPPSPDHEPFFVCDYAAVDPLPQGMQDRLPKCRLGIEAALFYRANRSLAFRGAVTYFIHWRTMNPDATEPPKGVTNHDVDELMDELSGWSGDSELIRAAHALCEDPVNSPVPMLHAGAPHYLATSPDDPPPTADEFAGLADESGLLAEGTDPQVAARLIAAARRMAANLVTAADFLAVRRGMNPNQYAYQPNCVCLAMRHLRAVFRPVRPAPRTQSPATAQPKPKRPVGRPPKRPPPASAPSQPQ